MLELPIDAWFGSDAFGLVGGAKSETLSVRPLGTGHINQTFLITAASGDYVLQGINRRVFTQPQRVIDNQITLVAHLQADSSWPYRVPHLLPTGSGALSFDAGGTCWRLSERIAPARTLQVLSDASLGLAAGLAFGRFQRAVTDLASTSIRKVISNFHNLDHYLAWLAEAAEMRKQRARLGSDERSLLRALRDREQSYRDVPFTEARIIHGDCKVNNLLFAPAAPDNKPEVVAVLDLDTCMLGQWWWDFGDLVRSAAGGTVDLAMFAALAEGFFATEDSADHVERGDTVAVEQALRAPAYMSYMLSVRFLADHFDGDRYFLVDRAGDNLARSAAQYELLQQFEVPDLLERMRDQLERLL